MLMGVGVNDVCYVVSSDAKQLGMNEVACPPFFAFLLYHENSPNSYSNELNRIRCMHARTVMEYKYNTWLTRYTCMRRRVRRVESVDARKIIAFMFLSTQDKNGPLTYMKNRKSPVMYVCRLLLVLHSHNNISILVLVLVLVAKNRKPTIQRVLY
jgi:hypothetical protein